MPSYTVTITDEQEEVLAWVVEKRLGSTTKAEVVQERIDNYLAERGGHFDQASERLARLSPSDKAQILPPIRAKLGLT
jgi:hypothetical protein|tara:strand:+ start:19020 stop:19253 length:234 start_codon:yes stop_codon:yes gene_type:complete